MKRRITALVIIFVMVLSVCTPMTVSAATKKQWAARAYNSANKAMDANATIQGLYTKSIDFAKKIKGDYDFYMDMATGTLKHSIKIYSDYMGVPESKVTQVTKEVEITEPLIFTLTIMKYNGATQFAYIVAVKCGYFSTVTTNLNKANDYLEKANGYKYYESILKYIRDNTNFSKYMISAYSKTSTEKNVTAYINGLNSRLKNLRNERANLKKKLN